jgi:D-glycero-D-manno-heptose 1,7-bisphosphate phosphatase
MSNALKKIAFIDRDGVINKKAQDHCYITKIDDFTFNDGIFEFIKKIVDDGFEIIIITNQRGIARGIITIDQLNEIHSFLLARMKEKGIEILDIFYCPHEKNSCNCRKPKPGLLIQAFDKYKIDKSRSILISDSIDDVGMGKNFGIAKNIFVETNCLNSLNDYWG